METLWFGLAWLMLIGYVVLDGFDFGAGVMHLWAARTDAERRQVLRAIGPFWDGNEVWLLAGGGVLFLAFPMVLSSGLSGFYLAVMMLLWVLILRGISIEFRSHLEDSMWRAFWDVVFAVASTLAPVLLGAAFGNLLRGVPLNEEGWFALSLFESFSPHGELGVLDWYTVLAGVLALAAVARHGALFLAWKTDGAVRERCQAASTRLLWIVLALWAGATLATMSVTPGLYQALAARPLAWGFTGMAVLGLVVSARAAQDGGERRAFLGSCAFIVGMLAATAASFYPTMIRSITTPAWSLTAHNAAAGEHALRVALWWWPVGFVLVGVYFTVLFKLHRGRVRVDGDGY